MKKIIPALIILSFACTGCKKEAVEPNNNTIGTLSAKIDGKTKTFNISAQATQVSNLNPYKIRIVGYEKNVSEDYMEITIESPVPIVPGTYTNDTDPNLHVRIVYYVTFTSFYSNYHVSWEPAGSLRRTGSVTISEISNSSVKGTFSGTLFYSDILGTDLTNTLTNGMFNVSF